MKSKTINKRLISIVLALMTIVSAITTAQLSAYAATTAYGQISSSKVMKSYTITTGNTVPYTNSNLSTRGTENRASSSAYIAGSDELYVYKVASNSKGTLYAYVSFPVGSTRYKAYIPLSAITTNNSNHKKTTARGKVSTYNRSNGTGGSSSMYVAKGDTCYLIATSGNYYQIMYPVSNNGGWRLAWVTKANYTSYIDTHTHTYKSGFEAAHPHRIYMKCSACGDYYYTGATQKYSSCTTCYPSTSKLQHPVKNYSVAVSFGQKVNYMSAPRNYHIGVDYTSKTDSNVYSMGAGVVSKVGYNGANGNYVVIKHSISNKTVYSFYGHLKSYCVSAGSSVLANTKIGVIGATGSSGNGVNHLHFAVVDSLWSGSYYGYATSFSGNKVVYQGVTYYSPTYVINNGKLPS